MKFKRFECACLRWSLMAWTMACGVALSEDGWVGNWSLSLSGSEVGWLGVRLAEDGSRDAGLMWAVGGVKPVKDATWDDAERLILVRKASPNRVGGKVVWIRDGDVLTGQWRGEDGSGETFSGERMPPMPPRPDLEKIRFGEPMVLFNGKDLTGWRPAQPEKINGWSVRDGVLANDTPKKDFSAYGDHANLRTDAEFEDFQLHIEYRLPAGEGGNSGVYLRGMYEAQVTHRDSRMQGIQGPGALFSRIEPSENAALGAGKWNAYDLTLVDRHVTVALNGVKVIDNQPVEGPTGGALISDVRKPGPIYLQGDHTSVEYRNIVLRPRIE